MKNQHNMAQAAQNQSMGFQNPSFGAQQQQQNPYYNAQPIFAGNQTVGMQGGGYQNPYYQMQQQNPYYAEQIQVPHSHSVTSWLGQTSSDRFIRGLVIGAAATYLLTNEKAQKAIIKTGMKLYGALAGGVEEIKEKIMDAKAEIEDTEPCCEDKED